MLKRTLTALLLIPPVIYLIGWSPKWLFLLTVAAAIVLALREYFALCRSMGFKVLPWAGYVGAVALCVAQFLPAGINYSILAASVVALVLLVSSLALRRSTDLQDYLVAVSVTVFGILYIGLTLSCLVPIRFTPLSFGGGWIPAEGIPRPRADPHPVLLLLLVIWAGDIGAYWVGHSLGRIPFSPRISPRKTWEGALAGLAGSLLVAWAFAHWFWKTIDMGTVMLLAGWVALAGQIGDLVESAIKRGANQKDSGTLLPGHGGFLDRIDSLLFGAPALWLAISLLSILR